ncbi:MULTISPECIES: ribose operon transcriptional repressor RbsR [Providencia]|uniref:ribose operon transcriptional repressor RbsR n=1 Tax=Providencia TaxID=586 RepID=UPI000A902DF7|nr:ribose operon transcriptional repressor RbsR [Providencia rettgeri]ELR5170539.1 ribose operon transcriptional repressor RbsR [Providencia rettgeri]ELR5212834.1 ribose operon transcriptional repressor RbsR [Providencia rettgeri]ELR5215433.1 ribose operon transcriptional repressor RbsR [Providencia rettgeri]HCH7934433.1 ribose operon transcriptional repressor RbsR [Providencia rettgeri]
MATMKDVARLAGVSTSTVSHVINQNRYVSESITLRVKNAIEELNYAPSALARSLKMNRTNTIGMLLTTSNNPFYAEVVRGVERSCYERGYSLILCNTEGDLQRMNHSLETLLQKRVDGLLIMCTEVQGPSKDVFTRYPSVPTVMMDWSPFDLVGDVIQDNSFLGGEIATRYLIDSGFTRIACIAGPQDKSPARARYQGFIQAMEQAKIEVNEDYIIFSDFEFAGGFESMNKLLELSTPPQAIFAGNDAMAVGAYQAIFQKGIKVPDDISIIGYDDIDLSPYMIPPLTTIHQPKDKLGKQAVDQLIYRMDNPEADASVLVLTPELIERQSVRKC